MSYAALSTHPFPVFSLCIPLLFTLNPLLNPSNQPRLRYLGHVEPYLLLYLRPSPAASTAEGSDGLGSLACCSARSCQKCPGRWKSSCTGSLSLSPLKVDACYISDSCTILRTATCVCTDSHLLLAHNSCYRLY